MAKPEHLIISWNIDGLRDEVFDYLKEFLEVNKPSILCLNETKRKRDYIERLFTKNLTDYNFIINAHNPSQWHGVAILIRKDIEFQEIDFDLECEVRADSRSPKAGEGRLIAFEALNIVFIATYSPNSGRGLKYLDYRVNQWDKAIFKSLKAIEKEVCWLGDLNVALEDIDVSNPKIMARWAGFTREEKESFEEFLKDKRFIDIWRRQHKRDIAYSWRGYNSAHRLRLDNIIISRTLKKKVLDSFILENLDVPTDHVPIGIFLKI